MTQPNAVVVGEKRTHTGAARVSHLLEHRHVSKRQPTDTSQEQQHQLVMQRGACSGERRQTPCSAKNTHITASKRRGGVRGAGESRRALSPWCHVALSGRLSGVLSASSVDRCIIAVASRWARLWRGERGKNHTAHPTHTCPVQPHVSLGEAMGATGWYGHGAGHPRQAVEAPTGQPNPRPPHTCYRKHFSPALA
jgi:hypothetical protein